MTHTERDNDLYCGCCGGSDQQPPKGMHGNCCADLHVAIDAYDQRLISEARKLADATPDQLAAMLPASVYGDNPDSGTVMAFSFGVACSMLRELAGTYERALYRGMAAETDAR